MLIESKHTFRINTNNMSSCCVCVYYFYTIIVTLVATSTWLMDLVFISFPHVTCSSLSSLEEAGICEAFQNRLKEPFPLS